MEKFLKSSGFSHTASSVKTPGDKEYTKGVHKVIVNKNMWAHKTKGEGTKAMGSGLETLEQHLSKYSWKKQNEGVDEKTTTIPLKDVKHCPTCGHQTSSKMGVKEWCPNCQKNVKAINTYKLKEGVKMSKIDRILEKYLYEEVPPIDTELPPNQKKETNIAMDRAGDTVQRQPVAAPTQTHQAVTNAAQAFLAQMHTLVNTKDADPKDIVANIKRNLEKFNKEHMNHPAPEPTFKKAK